ncbi:unnamed protein product [Oppiella nova]|uniref:Large ribosomal subunit protein uL18m n=1 Tax=Oppiella nova TaxID=334625 RepID=A0A7R9M3V8_9ACAR|nr:unnamed protein product [Oppiella nova]CAG2170280.1 unnamed protein product [Oppiella nova]
MNPMKPLLASSALPLISRLIPIVCRLSTVSNKRITRMASDLEVSESELHSNGNESVVKTRLVNRNPRNLEQLLFDKKPLGYELDLSQRTFWNKIVFSSGGKHLTAKIVHNSGRVVVSAGTRETAVGQQLKSSSGVSAATSLGHVLALRAIESGILELFVGIEYESNQSLKVKAFLSALKANGLVLSEQPFVFERQRRDH